MKINGNAIRPGMVIEHLDRLWVAVKIQHTQPGKGGAYLQVELKDLRDGTKLNERFRASENVARARLDQDPVRPDLAIHAAEQRPAQERQHHHADAGQDGAFMGRGNPQKAVELLALVPACDSFLAKETGEHGRPILQ